MHTQIENPCWEARELSVEELTRLFQTGEYEVLIDSPDEFVPVTDVWFSGEKEIWETTLEDGTVLESSAFHPLETPAGFVEAQHLTQGTLVLTERGWIPVLRTITHGEVAPTFDVEVNYQKHRFFANGISVHNTYGGSAWTVSRNMHSSVEQAQVRIDNFFSKLTVLREYVIKRKADVRATGRVVNLFGRVRDMRRWSHSQAPTEKERRQDRGYAERTALNHPIQSTAAEILKIAMIRANQYLAETGHNPLAGLAPPQQLALAEQAYLSLVYAMLSSVHDELVFIGADARLNEVIPPIYTVMQLADVLTAFQAGFTLELDCEFDKTRSWTASDKFDTAKIYLLNRLKARTTDAANGVSLAPNMFVCDFSLLSPTHLSGLAEYLAAHPEADADAVALGVLVGEVLYLHPSKVPVTFLESWNVPFKKAVLS